MDMKKTIIGLVGCAVMLSLALVGSFKAEAQDQARVGINTRWGYFTNAGTLNITNTSGGTALLIAGSGSATVTSSNITVYRGRGLAFFPNFAGTNAGTDTLTVGCDVTYDGTNWTTTQPISPTFTMNGATGVIGYSNVPASQLDNVLKLRVTKVSNSHASSLFLTNLVWSIYP